MPEVFLRRAFTSAETSTYSEYFLPQQDFLVPSYFRWLLLLQRWRWYSQLILTNIVQDMKHSSGFYFAPGHSALWWFNCNPRDPTLRFTSSLLWSSSWGKWIGLGSDRTPPPLWPINTDQYCFFFDLLYLPATRCRLQNRKKKKRASSHLVVSPWIVVFGQTVDLPIGSESGNRFSSGNRLSLFSPYSSSFVIICSLSVIFEHPKTFFSSWHGCFLKPFSANCFTESYDLFLYPLRYLSRNCLSQWN